MDPKLIINLDRPRAVKWSMRAVARFGRIEDPPAMTELLSKNSARAFYALCAWLWAAIEDSSDDFAKPEDLADLLEKPETQTEAINILLSALRAAGVLKEKKSPETQVRSPATAERSG